MGEVVEVLLVAASLCHVAGDFCEAEKPSMIVADGVDHGARPERPAVFAEAPAFGLRAALSSGGFERALRGSGKAVFLSEKAFERLADDLVPAVALDPLCTRVPAGNDPIGVQHVDGVVHDALNQQAELALVFDQAPFRLV